MRFHENIHRFPKSAKAAMAVLIGLACWSAVSNTPVDLDSKSNHSNGSRLQRLLLDEGLLDVSLQDESLQDENAPDESFHFSTSEPLMYNGRNSICPAINENGIVNDRKATIVLMAYSPLRLEDVAWVLRCYQKMTGAINKIIFVWNNLEMDLPEDIIPSSNTPNVVPVQFFKPEENLMTNRFDAPSRFADANSPVILIDDDVLLTAGLISGMVDYWKGEGCNEQCVVGLDPRHANPYTAEYEIHNEVDPPSIVIGKTILASNHHFQAFMLNENLVRHSGPPEKACEDLTFSFYVTDRTGLLPVVVRGDHYRAEIRLNSQKKFLSQSGEFIGSRYDIPEFDGMSAVGRGWMKKRHDCVEWNLHYHDPSLRNILIGFISHQDEPMPE